MPQRPRVRLRRFLLALAILVLVALLLELNRLFPGLWPGGKGGGFRGEPASGTDTSRVKRSTEDVPWPPPQGVRVEVRGPEGPLTSGWRIGVGAKDVQGEPTDGAFALTDPAAFREGVRVAVGDRMWRHSPGPRTDANRWVVQAPEATGAPAAQPRTIRTRVVDASAAPLAGAEVTITTPGGVRRLAVGADGTVSTTLDPKDEEGARLEVRAPGRPTVSVPIDDLPATIQIPEGRSVSAKISDDKGARPKGARLTVRYAVGTRFVGSKVGEPVEQTEGRDADEEGGATITVPDGVPATLLAEALDRAPAARRLAPGDGGAPVEFVLEPGIAVPVRVLDADGAPAAGARVVAVASVEGMPVVREATAGGDGVAKVGPFGAGDVEVYARVEGHGWAATTAKAANAMGTVDLRLVAGKRLVLVVEDPEGKPLAGVLVRASPEDDRPPDPTPPAAPEWRTDAKGLLRVDGLSDRPLRLRLSAPGRAPQTLRDVRPGPTVWFATLP